MTPKPAPVPLGQPFPRIPVNQHDDSAFAAITQIAVFAADNWTFGPHGPYANPEMTGAERTRGQIREALLHLLELGLIDIDTERLHLLAETGIPMQREQETR